MLKPSQKFISSLITIIFVIAVFFCLNSGLNHTNNANPSCCVPTSSHAHTLQMDFGEHLQHWQQIFIVTRTAPNDLLVLLNIFFISLGFSLFILRFRNSEVNPNLFSVKVCKERNAIAKLFNHILQALSKGILNPRLYEFIFRYPLAVDSRN